MLRENACRCYVFGVVWPERSGTKNELLRGDAVLSLGREMATANHRAFDKLDTRRKHVPIVYIIAT